MSDNYNEESKPLLRLLHTETFRFILVHFNHFLLIERLKNDLTRSFPDRAISEINAEKISYRELLDSYYELGKGFFLVYNFQAILKEPEKYHALNLRRDQLAKYPIAMICFISPEANELKARDIMEKMPDLWSFRSLLVDLIIDFGITKLPSSSNSGYYNPERRFSSLGGYSQTDKLQELERLKDHLGKTSMEEKALHKTLNNQIITIQEDLGLYFDALKTISVLKRDTTHNEDLGSLYVQEGDILVKIGQYSEANEAYLNAITIFSEEPEYNRRILAEVHRRIGSAFNKVGNLDVAVEYFKKSNNLIKEHYETNPRNVFYLNNLANSYLHLAQSQSVMGNLAEALFFAEEASKLNEEAGKLFPLDKVYKMDLAVSYSRLGDIYKRLGNYDKALSYQKMSNDIFKELYETKDIVTGGVIGHNLAASYNRLGDCNAEIGDQNNALAYYEQAFQLIKESYEAFPENANFKEALSSSYIKLGRIQYRIGDFQKALFSQQEAGRLGEELNEAYPENPNFKSLLSIPYLELGNIYDSLGDIDKSATSYEKSLRLSKKLYCLYPKNVDYKRGLAGCHGRVGELCVTRGELKKALANFNEEVKLYDELLQSSPGDVVAKEGLAESFLSLGDVERIRENFNEAFAYYAKGKKILNELITENPEILSFRNRLAGCLGNLGTFYSQELGQDNKGRQFFLEAKKLLETILETSPNDDQARSLLEWINHNL